MPLITNYVNSKVDENGDISYRLKMDKYTRGKLADIPDGATIFIGPSKYGANGFGAYWLPHKDREETRQPEIF